MVNLQKFTHSKNIYLKQNKQNKQEKINKQKIVKVVWQKIKKNKKKNRREQPSKGESVSVGNWLITDDRGCDDPLEGLFLSLSFASLLADRRHPLSPATTTALLTVYHTRTHAYIYIYQRDRDRGI